MSPLRRLSLVVAALVSFASPSRADVPALATALDTPTLSWNTGGEAAWDAQSAVTQDGVDAAKVSGLSAIGSSSWIETTVNAPGFLSWQWRLDLSAEGGSVLELIVGGDPQPTRSLYSSEGWVAASATIAGSGPVVVRWRLLRNSEANGTSSDAGYLDTVAFAPFGSPGLLAPSAITSHGFTANWTAVDRADSYEVEFATSPDFSGSVIGRPVNTLSCTIDGLDPATTYYYRVVAQGPDAISSVSATRSVTTLQLSRPANDAFAAASALSGVSGAQSATTVDATIETGEPQTHRGSVWFRWTAPSAGLWRFRATPSGGTAPALYVYSGSGLAALDLAAAGVIDAADGSVFAEFETTSGATYQIALDAPDGAQTPATLAWERLALYTTPANDAFAAAATLSGSSGSVDATNLHATAEAGEAPTAAHSIWFTWKAPAAGVWTLDTAGSAIAASLSVWSGASLSNLDPVAFDAPKSPAAARVSLAVAKDVVYRVSLDGQNGAEGALRLAWSLAVPSVGQTITPPEIADQPVDALPITLEAVADSGLPVAYALVSGPATLADDVVTLTGQPGVVKLLASQAGDATYLPASVAFQFTVQPPPANDRVGTPALIAGASDSVDADLRYATANDGEAYPAHRSRWYRWNAAATGILTLDTTSGAANATLSVFTGAADALQLLASDVRAAVRPRLEVPVLAGASYLVAIDTLEEVAGVARLAWSFSAPARAQTITFPDPADVGASSAPFRLDASASSGLPVSFTLVSGPATLAGDMLAPTGKPGTVILRASQAGDSYYKPADDVTVSFAVRPPPANDDASAAVRLVGASGSVVGSNLDASAQAFDPQPANHSVWWTWIAPATGRWTVDTAGSEVPVTLSILRGASPASLELLDVDLHADARGRLVVPVYKGNLYWIAVDTLGERLGALKLAWSLAPPSLAQTILFDQNLPDLVVGDQPPVLYPTSSSGLPVDVAVVSGPARIVDGALVLTGKTGVVTLRATQPGDALYTAAAPVTRSFSVAQVPAIKITISDLRQTYDGTPKSVNVVTDRTPRLGDVVVTYNGSAQPPTNAGSYSVVVAADLSKASARLVIDKIPLLVTADNQRKLAGQANPPLTLAYTGLAPGDDPARLVRAPVAATSATAASPGGSYAIKVSGGVSPNYVFTYAPGILTVDTFAGRYEALLTGPDATPLGKVEFSVASSGKAITGKLTLARESAPLPLKGELALDSTFDLAEATLSIQGKTGAYVLSLSILLDGRFTAGLSTAADGVLSSTSGGRRLFAPGPKDTLAWAGAHTVLLLPASDSALSAPAGAGHAAAAIDAKGGLKLSGKLADGTPTTAALSPDPDGGYRLFAAPYVARKDSFIAGEFGLVDHPDSARFPGRRYLPASRGVTLSWAKAASAADNAYLEGFGPLATTLVIDPWIKPAAPIPVALRFGPFDLDLGERTPLLPASGAISTAGLFTLGGPATTPANVTRFSLKLTPATGAFSGSFVLSDQVSPAPAKPEQRTVSFSGTMRIPPASESASGAVLGRAHVILPPLSTSGVPTRISGELRLEKP